MRFFSMYYIKFVTILEMYIVFLLYFVLVLTNEANGELKYIHIREHKYNLVFDTASNRV